MTRLIITLAIGMLLWGGCRAPGRRVATAPPPPPETAPAAQPAPSPSTTRLRYYDIRDLETKNGIMVVRASPQQLAALDQHLSAIRGLLAESKKQAAAHAAETARNPKPRSNLVVQIHAVADLIEKTTGDALLVLVHEGLGPEPLNGSQIRLQGTSALVVKASPAAQDRVAAILDGLRRAP